ncbi:uncharacterized protein LOC142410148 [Mycteria americana]|uniref:uncharacterized protein LOC142410148 n=1 Tax=Mycteria americana TaxID=33587 RepID=UPI003F588667
MPRETCAQGVRVPFPARGTREEGMSWRVRDVSLTSCPKGSVSKISSVQASGGFCLRRLPVREQAGPGASSPFGCRPSVPLALRRHPPAGKVLTHSSCSPPHPPAGPSFFPEPPARLPRGEAVSPAVSWPPGQAQIRSSAAPARPERGAGRGGGSGGAESHRGSAAAAPGAGRRRSRPAPGSPASLPPAGAGSGSSAEPQSRCPPHGPCSGAEMDRATGLGCKLREEEMGE